MTSPCRVVCFCEDVAQERFIRALVQRAAQQQQRPIRLQVLNASHGSAVWGELSQYLGELTQKLIALPDVLVVVIDGNCQKPPTVRKRISEVLAKSGTAVPSSVCAIPDPHIERWYVQDFHALQSAIPGAKLRGKLHYKCQRSYYKLALLNAIRAANIGPLLGGAEYGEQVANAIRPPQMDKSFRKFWTELCQAFQHC